MSDNKKNTPADQPVPIDSSDQPMPPVPLPAQPMPRTPVSTQPDPRVQSAVAGSDHEIVRGSAAAVDPSTTAVATRAKKRDKAEFDRGP